MFRWKLQKMLFRLKRRCSKRVLFIFVLFAVSIYFTILLLFGDFNTVQVWRLTDLSRCPACYGISMCPELYSNVIKVDSSHHWFNVKNIYYGTTRFNAPVVMKKLAHDFEFEEFDSNLCSSWKLKKNCKPSDLLNTTNVKQQIIKLVEYNISWPDSEPRKGLVMCPYADSIFDFITPVLSVKGNPKAEMINIWTMLSINPEPIMLKVTGKYYGWPVPAYAGVCGRLEILGYEGERLSSLMHVSWRRRLYFALQILDAAMQFTLKHKRYRFYLMDWSTDNIVANSFDKISFVDLEDVIVLDKQSTPNKELPDWYKRYSREDIVPGFSFSIENLCKHHFSDHNFWAACYIIGSNENPLLFPIPKDVNASRPHFERLLYDCLHGSDRFHSVTMLQDVIKEMLDDKSLGS